MKPYLTVLGAQYRMLLQYRARAWAGLVTQLFWGLIRVAIFTSFYQSSVRVQPMLLPDIITYLWMTQALFALTYWSASPEVSDMIRNGSIAYELLRPIDLYWFWFARAVASRLAPTTLRSIPLFVVAGLLFELKMPASATTSLLFLGGVATGVAIIAALSCILTTALLYTLSSEGIMRLSIPLTLLFSGLLVPLPLLPSWFQPVVYFLPLRHILDTPIRLYTGNISPPESVWVFLHAAIWFVTLVLWGRWLLKRAVTRLVAQGG